MENMDEFGKTVYQIVQFRTDIYSVLGLEKGLKGLEKKLGHNLKELHKLERSILNCTNIEELKLVRDNLESYHYLALKVYREHQLKN